MALEQQHVTTNAFAVTIIALRLQKAGSKHRMPIPTRTLKIDRDQILKWLTGSNATRGRHFKDQVRTSYILATSPETLVNRVSRRHGPKLLPGAASP